MTELVLSSQVATDMFAEHNHRFALFKFKIDDWR